MSEWTWILAAVVAWPISGIVSSWLMLKVIDIIEPGAARPEDDRTYGDVTTDLTIMCVGGGFLVLALIITLWIWLRRVCQKHLKPSWWDKPISKPDILKDETK